MYCECGCGGLTYATQKQPVRFLPNHHKRSLKSKKHYGFVKVNNGTRWAVYNRKQENDKRVKYTLWSRIAYQNFYLNGEEIPDGMEVHHKDENPSNDIPENLELLPLKNHVVYHRGKVTKLEKNKQMLTFASASQAGIFLSRTPAAICWAIKNKKEIDGWKISIDDLRKAISSETFLLEEENKQEICSLNSFKGKEHNWGKRKIKTVIEKDGEKIEFTSCNKASQYLNVSNTTMSTATRKGIMVKGWKVYYNEQ